MSNNSRAGGRTLTQPDSFTNGFDLIKVRQQLQLSSSSSGSTFWGRTLVNMVKQEGILSIYKGLSASLLREAMYSGIRMGCYDQSKAFVLKVVPYGDKDSFAIKLGAGMGSGMLGAAVASPADLLKVRSTPLCSRNKLSCRARRSGCRPSARLERCGRMRGQSTRRTGSRGCTEPCFPRS